MAHRGVDRQQQMSLWGSYQKGNKIGILGKIIDIKNVKKCFKILKSRKY